MFIKFTNVQVVRVPQRPTNPFLFLEGPNDMYWTKQDNSCEEGLTLAGTCAFGSYLFLRTNGSELRVRLYPDNVEYMNNIKVKPKQSVIDCV